MRFILFYFIIFYSACTLNKLPSNFTGSRNWNQLPNVSNCEKLLLPDGFNQWDSSALNKLKHYHWPEVKIMVFAGNWCSDTQKWLPRMASLQKEIQIPQHIFEFYLLDLNKESEQKLEKAWNITHVPTFIIVKQGVELGRIVETPERSLEAHLSSLLP